MPVFWLLLILSCLSGETLKSILVNGEKWESPADNFFEATTSTENYVDIKPHIEVNPNDVVITPENKFIKDPENKYIKGAASQSEGNGCSTFFTRFINILVNAINLKSDNIPEEDFGKISIDIWVSKRTLRTLQKFGAGEAVPLDLLDESFVNIFNHDDSYRTQFLSFMYESASGIFSTVVNLNFLLTLAVLSPFALFAIIVIRNGFNFSSLFVFLFFIYYIACVGHELWKQYEDILLKRTLMFEETLSAGGREKIPDVCFPSKMGYFDRIINTMIRDVSCEKYIQSKKSIWSEINLYKATYSPIFGFLFLMPEVGDLAGQSVNKFTGHFMFPMNWIMACFLIYCTISCFWSQLFFNIPHLLHSTITGVRSLTSQHDFGNVPHNAPQNALVQGQAPPYPSVGSTVNNFHYYGSPQLQIPQDNLFPTKAIAYRNLSTKQIKEFQKRRQDQKRERILSKKENKKNK